MKHVDRSKINQQSINNRSEIANKSIKSYTKSIKNLPNRLRIEFGKGTSFCKIQIQTPNSSFWVQIAAILVPTIVHKSSPKRSRHFVRKNIGKETENLKKHHWIIVARRSTRQLVFQSSQFYRLLKDFRNKILTFDVDMDPKTCPKSYQKSFNIEVKKGNEKPWKMEAKGNHKGIKNVSKNWSQKQILKKSNLHTVFVAQNIPIPLTPTLPWRSGPSPFTSRNAFQNLRAISRASLPRPDLSPSGSGPRLLAQSFRQITKKSCIPSIKMFNQCGYFIAEKRNMLRLTYPCVCVCVCVLNHGTLCCHVTLQCAVWPRSKLGWNECRVSFCAANYLCALCWDGKLHLAVLSLSKAGWSQFRLSSGFSFSI